jgi:hypothetical protein
MPGSFHDRTQPVNVLCAFPNADAESLLFSSKGPGLRFDIFEERVY